MLGREIVFDVEKIGRPSGHVPAPVYADNQANHSRRRNPSKSILSLDMARSERGFLSIVNVRRVSKGDGKISRCGLGGGKA